MPPLHSSFDLQKFDDHEDEGAATVLDAPSEMHPIAGFACIIDYVDASGEASERLITCRTLEVKGDCLSICGICHLRKAYRRFILDRIQAVYDPMTGERLGDGSFFMHFDIDVRRDEGEPTWGLSRSRKQILLAGLNILAYMARCDGEWHPLEEPVFTDFIEEMWALKGWSGEPPICAIMDHAHRLAPDSEIFFDAIAQYSRSSGSKRLILDKVQALIDADGVISPEEFHWALEMREALTETP